MQLNICDGYLHIPENIVVTLITNYWFYMDPEEESAYWARLAKDDILLVNDSSWKKTRFTDHREAVISYAGHLWSFGYVLEADEICTDIYKKDYPDTENVIDDLHPSEKDVLFDLYGGNVWATEVVVATREETYYEAVDKTDFLLDSQNKVC